MLRWGRGLAAAAMALCASQAQAGKYDSTELFAGGSWSVDVTYSVEEGRTWCAADTRNRNGQWFSVVVYDAGGAAVFIGDPEWRLSPRDVRFRLDIDYSRWDIDGSAEGAAVMVFLNGKEAAPVFLDELMKGSAVAIYNDAERRLATFSLDGSHAAMGALFECWDRIDRRDPFTQVADPF